MRRLPLLKHFLWFVLLAFCATGADLLAQNSEPISKANQEYNAGRFSEAANLYETALATGERNAALFYNLGNARFRLGELGRAILQYERALALEPQHPEAAANLRLAQDKARALELRKHWSDRLGAWVTTAQLSIAANVAFWAAVFALAALLLARRRLRIIISLLVASVVALALAAGALYLRERGNRGRDFAVVTGQKVEARVATADSAGTVLLLPPGSEIKILSTRGDWIYAALPNELRGWIPAQSAELVRR